VLAYGPRREARRLYFQLQGNGSIMANGAYRWWGACLLGLAALVVAVPGCGGGGKPKVTITGAVTYKGKPLSGGMLQFAGTSGRAPSSAIIQKDGTFTMTDVDLGEAKASILVTPQSSGRDGDKAGSAPKVTPDQLPEKYRDPEKSGVKVTITTDTKHLDIKLD